MFKLLILYKLKTVLDLKIASEILQNDERDNWLTFKGKTVKRPKKVQIKFVFLGVFFSALVAVKKYKIQICFQLKDEQ